jgi:diphosphomevalonate decarboxylase
MSSSSSSSSSSIRVTHSAPSNIATVKYWGKRDARINVPINSSVSVTMNQDDLKAITTIVASPAFGSDRLWLNGVEEDIVGNKRVQAVLREVRARCGGRVDDGGVAIPASTLAGWRVHIVSRNTFPTAAGLASSAAGYACLVDALADVYGARESYAGELTTIARMGSGSACRSMYGGFVRWEMGAREDGSDSLAVQVAKEDHWPELALLIAIVSDRKKETGSTEGMSISVATSDLLSHRAAAVVPKRLPEMEAAYIARDFPTFAKLTMQDSNSFHSVCADTYPPIFYMNDVSRRIIALVHAANEAAGKTIAGYTFDAGPNAVIFTLRDDAPTLLATLLNHFPPAEEIPATTAESTSSSVTASAAKTTADR